MTHGGLPVSDREHDRIESLSLQDRKAMYSDGINQQRLRGVTGGKSALKMLRLRSAARNA